MKDRSCEFLISC